MKMDLFSGFYHAEAVKYGVNGAIFLNHIRYWLSINRDNNNNFYEGKFWTYNTICSYAKIFPFWSERQIRHLIEKLKETGAIVTGNFNKKNFDKTLWYTFSDELYPEEFREALVSLDRENEGKHNKNNEVTKLANRNNKIVKSIGQNWQTNTNRLTTKNYPFNIHGQSLEHPKKNRVDKILDIWASHGLPIPEFKTNQGKMAWQRRMAGKVIAIDIQFEALDKAVENYKTTMTSKDIDYNVEVSLEAFLSRKSNGEYFYERFMEGFFNINSFKKILRKSNAMEDHLNKIPKEKRYNFFDTNSKNKNSIETESRKNGKYVSTILDASCHVLPEKFDRSSD